VTSQLFVLELKDKEKWKMVSDALNRANGALIRENDVVSTFSFVVPMPNVLLIQTPLLSACDDTHFFVCCLFLLLSVVVYC